MPSCGESAPLHETQGEERLLPYSDTLAKPFDFHLIFSDKNTFSGIFDPWDKTLSLNES